MPRALVYALWVIGCAGLLAIVSCDPSSGPDSSGAWDPRFPSEEERFALMAWELIPDPPRPKLGRLVRTPKPPRYTHRLSMGMPDPGTSQHDVLHDRLDLMLTNHPDPAISETLSTLLAQDKVVLEEVWWDPRDSTIGAAFYVRRLDNGNLQPTLVVNFWHVAAMRTRHDVLLGMLVLTHEYTHYKQWTNADHLTRPYFESAVDIPCRDHWEMERGAYMADCEASYTYGAADFNGGDWLCRRYPEETAFNQALFIHMLGSGYVERSPQCVSDWAKAAGHPHPEAFLPGQPVVMEVYEQIARPTLTSRTETVTGAWSVRH